MKNLNNYIIEKFKIKSNIKIPKLKEGDKALILLPTYSDKEVIPMLVNIKHIDEETITVIYLDEWHKPKHWMPDFFSYKDNGEEYIELSDIGSNNNLLLTKENAINLLKKVIKDKNLTVYESRKLIGWGNKEIDDIIEELKRLIKLLND